MVWVLYLLVALLQFYTVWWTGCGSEFENWAKGIRCLRWKLKEVANEQELQTTKWLATVFRI
jgi:hypothetical protein